MDPDDLQRLSRQYADLSEIELMDVARRYDGLHPEAQSLLREEFARRSLDPPLIDQDAEFAYQDLVTVARYRDLSEAIVARAALEEAQIFCFLKDENMIRMAWGYSNFLGGLRLQVPAQDAARAQEILNAPRPESIDFAQRQESEESGFAQPTCPKCHSTQIDLRKPRRTNLVLLWFFGIPIPTRSKHRGEEVWRCLTCGTTWLEDAEPPQPAP
jgi:hypothetical protein